MLIDYELRGYKINVAMAERSAPRAPLDQGYLSNDCLYNLTGD